MATDTELQTLAEWLEVHGFTHRKRRGVTMTYLATVCGDCTPNSLRAICRYLLTQKGQPLKWLALKRIAHATPNERS